MRLHRFHGGLRLDGCKTESTSHAIRDCPLPATLVLPLLQHPGAPAVACVEIGQQVRRGQRIGEAVAEFSAHLHAPAAGIVVAIESRPLPHESGLDGLCIVLAVDRARPTADELLTPRHDWERTSCEELRDHVHRAGLVGLGGAAFPTAQKLQHGPRLLVLNGVECEPYIACDDALLRERAADVVRGGRVLRRAVGAERAVLAIEHRMREALAAAAQALTDYGCGEIELVEMPAVYPQGGERQLVQALTGLEVPSGSLPRALGVLVHNVGTAAAVWRAVAEGEPLLERIVSVTGPGVAKPANFRVALGTPISHLIEQAGGYTEAAERLVLGGPLRGLALPHDDFPIVKASNCVLVLSAAQVRKTSADEELPCIRCGECSRICPVQLLPQELHRQLRTEALAGARDLGVLDCIECGCCDLVCPSHIPLVEQFRWGKSELRGRERETQSATLARERFLARSERLAQQAREQAEQRIARNPEQDAAAALRAALARARKHDDPTPPP